MAKQTNEKFQKMTRRQMLAIASMLTGLVPLDMGADIAESWIQNPKLFRRIVGEAVRKAAYLPPGFGDLRRVWNETSTLLSEIEALDAEAKPDAQIDEMAKKVVGLPVAYDQALGLMGLIKRALGSSNVDKFNRDITQERFPLKGTDARTVNVRVEPFIPEETYEDAAERLAAAGHVLANAGDLSGFMASHPKEVEKWGWVVALSEDSRWTPSDNVVRVVGAGVHGAHRCFNLNNFCYESISGGGALVLSE